LSWALILAPERLVETSWLRPSLERLLNDDRLDALATNTGIDVRVVPRLVLAGYGQEDDTVAYFVRHRSEAKLVERKFRARLTGQVQRRRWGHQLESVWGRIGRAPHGYVGVGPHVAGFQYGGSAAKGPMRIAVLYETGKLGDIPRLLEGDTLAPLHEALGSSPAELLIPGPFTGELARGARGLFAAAFAVGLSLAPTERRTLQLRIILAGDYGQEDELERAVDFATKAWNDFAASDLGHLVGLTEPVVPPRAGPHELGLLLEVELDPQRLADGLAAATMDDVKTFLR
jgi:hypothetical protein